MKDLKNMIHNNRNGSRSALISAACFLIHVLADVLPFPAAVPVNDVLIAGTCILEEISVTALAAAVLLRNKKAVIFAAGACSLSAFIFFLADLADGFFNCFRFTALLAWAALITATVLSAKDTGAVKRVRFLPGVFFAAGILLYPLYYSFPELRPAEWAYLISRTLSLLGALCFAGLWLKADPSALRQAEAEKARRENRTVAAAALAGLLVFTGLALAAYLQPAKEAPAVTDSVPSAGLSMPEDAEPFTGRWVCGSASLTVRWDEDCFDVRVNRSSSALENTEWIYRCRYADDSRMLISLPTGTRTDYVHEESTAEFTAAVIYDDGEAAFLMDRDGCLIWRDDREAAGAGLRFERLSGLDM